MNRNMTKLAASLAVLGLVAAACSESEGDNGEGSSTVDVTVSSEAPVTGDVNQWALEYTGGTAGEASGDPIKIGYVNSEDFFPENTIGIDAAVEFVNKELGGAGGRPLEIVSCSIAATSDGAKCGTELANNSEIAAVLTGTILTGNVDLYSALDGIKPVIIGNGVTSDDFTTPAGQAFTAGSPGVITGMAGFVVTQLEAVQKVAILANNNDAGRAAADLLFKPVMEKSGIEYSYVGIDDTATVADVQSAITAVQADSVDVIVLVLTIQQCINFYDAVKALGIDPVVVATALCFGTPMTDHLTAAGESGPVPNGWYFGGYGYSYFRPDVASGMDTYVRKVQEYGKPAPGASTLEYTGFAGPSFANVMTLAKLINQVGADSLDYETLNTAIRTFTGPMMLQVGPLNCGKQIIGGLSIFVSVCASQMGIQQFKDGEWLSIADGLNGKAIDVTKV